MRYSHPVYYGTETEGSGHHSCSSLPVGRRSETEKVEAMSFTNGVRPVHPGEILRDELDALGMSAKALGVPVNRITAILNGQRSVTANTALRLARYFGTNPQVWLNLQKTWELRREEIESGRQVAERVQSREIASW